MPMQYFTVLKYMFASNHGILDLGHAVFENLNSLSPLLVCDEGAVIPSKSNEDTINGSPQRGGGALLSHQALNHTDEDTPPPIPPQCFKMEQTYENTA